MDNQLGTNIACVRKCALHLYGQKRREKGSQCTGLELLRHNLASTMIQLDSSPDWRSFKATCLRAIYQTAVCTHKHPTKTWNPGGKGQSQWVSSTDWDKSSLGPSPQCMETADDASLCFHCRQAKVKIQYILKNARQSWITSSMLSWILNPRLYPKY